MNMNKMLKKVNCENVVICVLVIILVVLVLYYVNKNNEGFNADKPDLYFFYVNWCGYCKKAQPTIDSLEQNNNNVNVKRIDCDAEENKALVEKHNIKGYPTLMLNKNGQMIPFEQASNDMKSELNAFINKNV